MGRCGIRRPRQFAHHPYLLIDIINHMNNVTTDIVAKLWNLCNVLKDDGVTYHQYVTELTYLLFLKMAKETGTQDQLPRGYRWDDLENKPAPERLEFYKILLIHLGSHGSMLVKEIFANASSFIKKPATLSTLVVEIDKLDWYSARQEGLGDLYEGLLEKNANEKKSGAGQYFTPRPLIDAMVTVMKPTLEDIIQDPAAGTGGFLIAADRYLREHSNSDEWTEAQQKKHARNTFYGKEKTARRLTRFQIGAPRRCGEGLRIGTARSTICRIAECSCSHTGMTLTLSRR